MFHWSRRACQSQMRMRTALNEYTQQPFVTSVGNDVVDYIIDDSLQSFILRVSRK